MRRTAEERFWSRVDKRGPDDCWEWQGKVGNHGYGMIVENQKRSTAHRFSWRLHNGYIPPGSGPHGTCVCHRCDNRRCVNPDHLFLGSQAENLSDMRAKGRAGPLPRRTRERGFGKLSVAQAEQLRVLRREQRLTWNELSLRFGVSLASARRVVHGRFERSRRAHCEV